MDDTRYAQWFRTRDGNGAGNHGGDQPVHAVAREQSFSPEKSSDKLIGNCFPWFPGAAANMVPASETTMKAPLMRPIWSAPRFVGRMNKLIL